MGNFDTTLQQEYQAALAHHEALVTSGANAADIALAALDMEAKAALAKRAEPQPEPILMNHGPKPSTQKRSTPDTLNPTPTSGTPTKTDPSPDSSNVDLKIPATDNTADTAKMHESTDGLPPSKLAAGKAALKLGAGLDETTDFTELPAVSEQSTQIDYADLCPQLIQKFQDFADRPDITKLVAFVKTVKPVSATERRSVQRALKQLTNDTPDDQKTLAWIAAFHEVQVRLLVEES